MYYLIKMQIFKFTIQDSHGQPVTNMENNIINHNNTATLITVNGVKVPISIDSAPVVIATMPPPPQPINLVPNNIPAAGSLLTLRPTNTNNNNGEQLADSSQNAYMPQNPVTIQLS